MPNAPTCIACQCPTDALVHTLTCDGITRVDPGSFRLCFECDHSWVAEGTDDTERCPSCKTGVGEPLCGKITLDKDNA